MASSVLNKKATKAFILKRIKAKRPGWDCSRVSATAIAQLEAFIRLKVDESIRRHPSNVKTFMNFD